jgi:hypothetical protein
MNYALTRGLALVAAVAFSGCGGSPVQPPSSAGSNALPMAEQQASPMFEEGARFYVRLRNDTDRNVEFTTYLTYVGHFRWEKDGGACVAPYSEHNTNIYFIQYYVRHPAVAEAKVDATVKSGSCYSANVPNGDVLGPKCIVNLNSVNRPAEVVLAKEPDDRYKISDFKASGGTRPCQ